jgi:hypothetical protein
LVRQISAQTTTAMTSARMKERLSGVERTENPNSSISQSSLGRCAPGRKVRVCGAIEPGGLSAPTSR